MRDQSHKDANYDCEVDLGRRKQMLLVSDGVWGRNDARKNCLRGPFLNPFMRATNFYTVSHQARRKMYSIYFALSCWKRVF